MRDHNSEQAGNGDQEKAELDTHGKATSAARDASGAASVNRIGDDDTFWSRLAQLTQAHQPAGIDARIEDAEARGQLDRRVRNATRAQYSTLFNAFSAMLQGGHSATANDALWTIFCALPDSMPGMKRVCFRVRYRVDVVGNDVTDHTELDWDAGSLKQLWKVFASLPEKDVTENKTLQRFIRYQGGVGNPYTMGFYDNKTIAAVSFTPDQISKTSQAGLTAVGPGDPLANVNRFDKTVRHEVGHAVDKELGISSSYCSKPEGGAWKTLGLKDWLEEMIRVGGFDDIFPSHFRDVVTSLFARELAKEGKAATRATLEAAFPGLSERPAAERAEVVRFLDMLAHAMQIDSAWDNAKPTTQLADRAFHHDGSSDYSYAAVARGRQVSNYQFRSPAEWAAEAYAAYYQPDTRGIGATLAERDPASKLWFDRHVHQR